MSLHKSFVCVMVGSLLLAASSSWAAEVIVDNTSATISGTWSTGTGAGCYGTNYRYRTVRTSSGSYVRWAPNLTAAGQYSVYAIWPTHSNVYNNARYTISHSGGTATVYKDQNLTPGQWVLLGTASFAAGSAGYVELNAQGSDTSKTVLADAIRFVDEPPSLTMATSPAGGGTTTPPAGTSTRSLNEVVNITATPAAGYRFVNWTVSAGSGVASPTSASTTVTMDQSKTVTANFEEIMLTMAVSPAGGGTTTPATGTSARSLNEVVNIQAVAAEGYTFDHWTVSAGSNVVSPTSASTTVTMDVAKTVTAVFNAPAVPQYRAVWADAFHVGFKSKAQIDDMISRAVTGRYNAIVAEVCAFHDNVGGGHGAYWNSNIVPKATDITTTGLPNADPLAYLVQQAHANNIEVHCWMVAFRISTAWPPSGNPTLSSHPEWVSVPRASAGLGTPAKTGSDYVLDAGSPDAQEYLMSVVRELVTNYEIDGINWDYIRYTQADGGYPTMNPDVYNRSGLSRFCQLYGYGCTLPLNTNAPPVSGDTNWNDFRRRTIDEVVRRTLVEMGSIGSNPRQPLRFSCDLVTWGNAPSDFSGSSAYGLFSNWELWLRKGWLDVGMPMCYYREYRTAEGHDQWYRNWVNKCVAWSYDRHMVIGQANYLNTMADSKTQMEYALNSAGADGTINYSYYSTVDSNMDSTTENDWTWYSYAGANIFTQPAPIPPMPWRDPATATEGTLWGRVTRNGLPVDDAVVQVAGQESVRTDGNGVYVVSLIPATAAGTGYTVTASSGADNTSQPATIFAGSFRRLDLSLDGGPVILQHPADGSVCPGQTAVFTVGATGTAPITYQWRKNGVDLLDGGHYSGVTTAALTISNADSSDVADYSCEATNSGGSATSNSGHLSLRAATTITDQPDARNVCAGTSATFTVAATGDGTVTYQWQKGGANLANGGHYSGVTSPTLTISSAATADAGSYACVVTAGCGSVTSNSAALTLGPDSDGDGWGDACDNCPSMPNSTQANADGDSKGDACDSCPNTIPGAPVDPDGCPPLVPGDFDRDGDVDTSDFDSFQGCALGPAVPVEPSCGSKKLDADEDIDQDDFGIFQRCLSGTNTLGNPNCAS